MTTILIIPKNGHPVIEPWAAPAREFESPEAGIDKKMPTSNTTTTLAKRTSLDELQKTLIRLNADGSGW